ncbi:hemerythrin domain-containing protein [Azospirillum sp. RWY-5-1]|uniref:Hemerythrin domain-containing protein n=1 Tax=Azospirillum oleiclasticum TaxID=2735135 RepID=A0ABX2T9S6_9PROT|nr:hemerythrin domain-containing protein [Azospirillum oleiclasticum]NYZ13820.1 hemerythrin domain-containing protein [Azospirillum oleiclasticum]NYZ21092.1 hemerythrin domain-containing protein [Azospirillum oleiclasticum]
MNALRIISEEHQSLAAVLHAIRFMLKEAAGGRLEPDPELFQAMVHYLDAYAEQRHHPKEELLFSRLRTLTDAAALDTLSAEHAAGPRRIADLKDALATFLADPRALDPFIAAFDRYAEFYRGHMMLEEEAVLPLARQLLSPADWREIDVAIAAEEARPAAEDFTTLFSRLVACAPAPIGHGPHPFALTP